MHFLGQKLRKNVVFPITSFKTTMKEALALIKINCIEVLHLNRYHKPILSIDIIDFYKFISKYPFYDAFLTNFWPILRMV